MRRTLVARVALGCLVLLLPACGGSGGGGGGGPSPTPPTVARVFPPSGALTEAATLTVRGSASAPEGVASVTVAGVAATSGDGFATWSASVPLGLGVNLLAVEATSALGAVTVLPPVSIERQGAVFTVPGGTVYDAASGAVYLSDWQNARLLRYVEATGQSSVVSGPDHGTGPSLFQETSLAVDAAGGRAFLCGSAGTPDEILAVDLATGNRSVLSSNAVGSGPALGHATKLAFQSGLLLASDRVQGALLWVDPATGDRTVLSNSLVGSGPVLGADTINAIALDTASSRAFAATSSALVGVDLATGNRTLLSGPALGSGPALTTLAMACDPAGNRALVSRNSTDLQVLSVNLATGDRVLLAPTSTPGDGPAPGGAAFLTLDAGGQRLLCSDFRRSALRALSLSTLALTDLWRPARGSAPVPSEPMDVLLEDDGHLLVLDQSPSEGIVRVDLTSGVRSAVPAGPGPGYSDAYAFTLDPVGGGALLAAWSGGGVAILSVDLVTGARTLRCDGGAAAGPVVNYAGGVGSDGSRAWLASQSPTGIYLVDLAAGTRSVLSDAMNGTGEPFLTLGRLMSDPANGRLIVGGSTASQYGLYAVDAAIGARTPLSTSLQGAGPAVWAASSVARRSGTPALLAAGLESLLSVDPLTGDRTPLSGPGQGQGPALSPAASLHTQERGDGLSVVFDRGLLAVLVVDPVSGDRLIVSK